MDVYGVLVGVETAAKIAESQVQSQKLALRKLVKQITDGEQQLIDTVAKRDALINVRYFYMLLCCTIYS